MAKLPTPADITKKMLDRSRGAGQDWRAGLERSRGTITTNMKAAGGRWKQAMTDAISQDRWGKAVANLTDDQIISAALKVGDTAWLNGITSREDKILAAWNLLGPKLQAHIDKIAAMPNVTDGDREKRMVENLRGMKALGVS